MASPDATRLFSRDLLITNQVRTATETKKTAFPNDFSALGICVLGSIGKASLGRPFGFDSWRISSIPRGFLVLAALKAKIIIRQVV